MNTRPTVLDLEASAAREGAKLTLRLLLANRHAHEVYFLHRFWKMAKSPPPAPAGSVDVAKAAGATAAAGPPRMVWDERGPYRYERGGILRTVFGPATVPPNTSVTSRQIPFASRIEPGLSITVEAVLDVPVVEFSLFNPPPANPEYEEVEVRRIAVVAYGVSPSEKVKIEPCPIDAAFYWVRAPDQLMVPTFADVPVDPLPVRRRKDPIARFLLPGEAP
jgi:hypothetical protein